MRISLFIPAVLVLTCPVLLLGQPSVRVSELKNTPFMSGALKITFDEFKSKALIANASKTIGLRVLAKIEVENTSADFAVFDPQRLSIVDKNGHQADMLGLESIEITEIFTAESRRIVPGARIKAQYVFTDKAELPARIYYGEKLLVIVTE